MILNTRCTVCNLTFRRYETPNRKILNPGSKKTLPRISKVPVTVPRYLNRDSRFKVIRRPRNKSRKPKIKATSDSSSNAHRPQSRIYNLQASDCPRETAFRPRDPKFYANTPNFLTTGRSYGIYNSDDGSISLELFATANPILSNRLNTGPRRESSRLLTVDDVATRNCGNGPLLSNRDPLAVTEFIRDRY